MDRIITSSRDRSSLLRYAKVLRNTYFLLSLTLALYPQCRDSQYGGTDAALPGLILTLVGMYGADVLTYKTANKPVGTSHNLLLRLPASSAISGPDS